MFLQLDFLVDFTRSSVQSTDFLYVSLYVEYNSPNTKICEFSRFYWKIGETYRKSMDLTGLLVKSTTKSSYKNKY